jgi:hypothetical protein
VITEHLQPDNRRGFDEEVQGVRGKDFAEAKDRHDLRQDRKY